MSYVSNVNRPTATSNDSLNNNENFLNNMMSSVAVANSTNQTLAGTGALVTFGTVVAANSGTDVTVTNATTITINNPGTYNIITKAQITSTAAGVHGLQVRVNGTAVNTYNESIAAAFAKTFTVSHLAVLQAGATITIFAIQPSGSAVVNGTVGTPDLLATCAVIRLR